MPSAETAPKSATLQMWAIVELMGHQRMAGEITEVTVAGHGFIRIDVPATSKVPAFTRMVSPSSIYAINPTTEDMARRAAEAFQPRPVQEWELPKALPSAATVIDDDDPFSPPCEGCSKHPAVGTDNEGVHLCAGCLATLEGEEHDEECDCDQCRFAAQDAAAMASAPSPSHSECAVCRKSGDPLTIGPDGLPRCRACGGDGA